MESYTSSSSSSPSNLTTHFQARTLGVKPPQSFQSSLHSIRKPSHFKPWKKPIAPLPPTPPKIYKVDPMNFRDLVQKLTGAPENAQLPPRQPRLQTVAPPRPRPSPLELASVCPLFSAGAPLRSDGNYYEMPPSSSTAFYHDNHEYLKTPESNVMASSSLELNLSPTYSYSWCSFPLLSPGTLSGLEQSAVL